MRAVCVCVGGQGALYPYCDDSYLVEEPDKIHEIFAQAPFIFTKVGLNIGYSLGKIELIPPRGYDKREFPYPLDDLDVLAPQAVVGFSACLGVPRHHNNNQDFINDALHSL